MLRADTFLGRAVHAARYPRPILRITASPRWARILVAAGAQPASADDAMTISYSGAWQKLELAILAARQTIRLRLPAFNEPLVPDHEMAKDLLSISEALEAVEHAMGAMHQTPSRSKVPIPASSVVLRPRTYEDARTVGNHYRSGTPVFLDLSALPDPIAKRMVDFAAGLMFGLRGSFERVGERTFMLLPAASPRDMNELRKTMKDAQNCTGALLMAVRGALHAPPPTEDRLPEWVRETARELRAITLPLDLTSVDLTDATTVRLEDLDQAIWTDSTKWPSPETANQIREASEEIAPGTYQVQTGTEQAPLDIALLV